MPDGVRMKAIVRTEVAGRDPGDHGSRAANSVSAWHVPHARRRRGLAPRDDARDQPEHQLTGEVAFQANTGDLWTVGPGGGGDLHLSIMAGTSPRVG